MKGLSNKSINNKIFVNLLVQVEYYQAYKYALLKTVFLKII